MHLQMRLYDSRLKSIEANYNLHWQPGILLGGLYLPLICLLHSLPAPISGAGISDGIWQAYMVALLEGLEKRLTVHLHRSG